MSGPGVGVRTFDAIVVGAGVVGAAAAYHLAGRGSVLVLEQFGFLHTKGSSHGGSRIFRHAYEHEAYVRLAVAADEGWRALERWTGERLLLRTGGLDVGTRGSGELDGIEAALRAAGRSVERLGADEVHGRFPAFRLADDQEALFQPDAGILPATRCVATMLRAAAAGGASLRDRERVVGLRATDGGVAVETEAGRYEAARVVVTGGAYLGRLLHDLSLPLRVEQQQVLYVRVGDGRVFAPHRMPVFIDRRSGVYGFPLFERPEAIKVSDHRGAPTIEPLERRDDLDERRAADTVRRARALLPGLTGEVVDGQTCLYTKTPDEGFLLDRHPHLPGVVVGGGFSGHGFKFGPALGEALADLATDGSSAFDLSMCRIDRFASSAALPA